ncbi:anti-sigma factor [Crenobacter sp. SG2305]|uniref:anti-sigma factor family protein n=1 Tax=Crenobacter oryzisoli TaxID=3056844 RepID=UPI0025AA920A|nr:anti-sigma factor [Crenobacter sp. SG2305]MDN0081725.1 anti-sigma factor [Crenobacter sp. SG2305]
MNDRQDFTCDSLEPGDDQRLLSALVDGELSAPERAVVEAQLAADPEAARRVAHYRAQKTALQALFPKPAAVPSLFLQRRTPWWRLGVSALACLLAGIALGLGLGTLSLGVDKPAFAQRADMAYAVYAPEFSHPVEVGAGEQAQLVSWLSRRLNRPLAVPSLQEYGYTLIGGRLLPGEAGPAAQFMYQNKMGDRVTLYVTVFAKHELTFGTVQGDGRRTIYWASRGMGYALSGRGNEASLRMIAVDTCNALGGHADSWSG